MIFYIHGLGSSSKSDKVKKTKEHFNALGINVVALDYDSGKLDSAYNSLKIQINAHLSVNELAPEEPILFMGTSLGAYFALCLRNSYLKEGYVTKSVLMNPAYDPGTSLLKYTGKQNKNWDTNQNYTIEEGQISRLVSASEADFKATDCLVFLQTGDELLDSNKALKFFGKRCIVQAGGSHRFENIESIFDTVYKYYNNLISGS